MNQTEFAALLEDDSKSVRGDLGWRPDSDHSPCLEFRADVLSDPGYPLFVVGSINPEAQTLSYALIHRAAGRVYALDLGKDHHNPSCEYVGERHKHKWTDQFRDKDAYVPDDITALWSEPVKVWQQFCSEARIQHEGRMFHPPLQQEPML